MWTPLAGTDPLDRETLHAFTLVVDNLNGETGFAGRLGGWVQLLQNGVQLPMGAVSSSTMYTAYGGHTRGAVLFFLPQVVIQRGKPGAGPENGTEDALERPAHELQERHPIMILRPPHPTKTEVSDGQSPVFFSGECPSSK
jgi:hypothetical protein